MIDPVQALVKTATSLAPSPTATVVPDFPTYEVASNVGTKTLWVVFVIMVLASAAFAAMSWTVPISRRLYHIVTCLITIIAAISYFGMATGGGVNLHHIKIREQHDHVPDTYKHIYREVYWARYADWAFTTPLLLLDLALLAGLNGGHMVMLIAADLVMIITGLFAAYGQEDNGSKWGWYTIACIAYLVVIWHLALHGRAQAMSKSGNVAKLFGSIAGYTLLLWTAYPVVWGLADGALKVSVDTEIIAYAVLDVLAKPVFGMWLLIAHARLPETNVEIGGFWSEGLGGQGRVRLGDDDEGA